MSDIYFRNEYVIVFPTFKETTLHKHDFYHIFFLGSDEKCEEIFVTGSGMAHTMPGLDECRLFLMIDPTSNLADHLRTEILCDGIPKRVKIHNPLFLTDLSDDGNVESKIEKWLMDNGFCTGESGSCYNADQKGAFAMEDRYLKATKMLDYECKSIQQLIKERGWKQLPEFERIKAIYNYVRDEILFGYNTDDNISASRVLSDGYGQCR